MLASVGSSDVSDPSRTVAMGMLFSMFGLASKNPYLAAVGFLIAVYFLIQAIQEQIALYGHCGHQASEDIVLYGVVASLFIIIGTAAGTDIRAQLVLMLVGMMLDAFFTQALRQDCRVAEAGSGAGS